MRSDLETERAVLDVGVLTDELTRDLKEALEMALDWGIRRIELREGATARFPGLTTEERRLVDEAVRAGIRVTAVSPGIFKGSVEDRRRLEREMDRVLPEALELAERFQCPTLIAFGFERALGEADSSRAAAMSAFESAATKAERHAVHVALENEPDFWLDRPRESAAMLEEIDHPLLALNWDPANTIWGGLDVQRSDFEVIRPFIRNLHVKDFDPADDETPWRPVGEGTIVWSEILRWIVEDTALEHVTLETHCRPLVENSRASLQTLRKILDELGKGNE